MLWMNGQIDQANGLELDEGFLFGRGVFETIRVGEQPFFWQEHLVRLNDGLTALKIRPPLDPDEWLDRVRALSIRHCVLKIMVSPANLILQTRPLPVEPQPAWRLTLAAGHRTANPVLLASKNLNYLDNLLAWEQARQNGFDDAIWLNADGQAAETSRANLFFLAGGRILTPDLSCGLLNGVVRQWVMTNFPVQAGFYHLADLMAAEAVFLTNSVIGIQPAGATDGQVMADSPIVRQIQAQYLASDK